MSTNYTPSNDYYAAPAAPMPAATAPKSTSWILGGAVAFLGLAVVGLGGGWAFSAQGQPTPAPAAQPVGIVAAAPAQGLPAPALPATVLDQGPTYVDSYPSSAGTAQVGQPASTPGAVTVPGPAAVPGAPGNPGVIIVRIDDPTSTTPQPAPPASDPPSSDPPAPEPPASEPPIVRDHRPGCVPSPGVVCVGPQQPVPPRPLPPQQTPTLPPYNPAPAPPSTCTIFNTCPPPTGPVIRDHR